MFNASNPRPNEEYYDYKSNIGDGLFITSDVLQGACASWGTTNLDVICPVYITLQSNYDTDLTVNFLVKSKFQMLVLYEGYSMELSSPKNQSEYQNFYYLHYPYFDETTSKISYKPVTINVYSLYEYLDIFVSVLP